MHFSPTMYQYKIRPYQAEVLASDPVIHKNYDLVRRLSKDWTVENTTAMALDEATWNNLVAFGRVKPADVEEEPAAQKTERTAPRQKAASEKQPGSDGEELTKAVTKLLNRKDGFKRGPVTYQDLDDDLKRKVTSMPATVQYAVPGLPTSPPSVKNDIPVFQLVVDDVVLGQNVYLVGGAGTGKTTLAQNVATALGREYMTINCSQWTAPTEIIGGQTLDGYQEGKLIEAWKNGYILILDELPKIDPNTAGLLNDALAKSKIANSLIFNSRKEKFVKHPAFAVIATGNVWPIAESVAYGANNKQDLSLLDRFAGSVYTVEKNPSLEKQVIGSEFLWTLCAELRRIIENLRYEAQISMRFMMTCRDSVVLEFQRLTGGSGIAADEGKTLKSCFDSFLEVNFSQVQRDTILSKFGKESGSISAVAYDNISKMQYRQGRFKELLQEQLGKAGYFKPTPLNGLGGVDSGYRVNWYGNEIY